MKVGRSRSFFVTGTSIITLLFLLIYFLGIKDYEFNLKLIMALLCGCTVSILVWFWLSKYLFKK